MRRTSDNDFNYVNNVNPVSAVEAKLITDWALNTDEITTRSIPSIPLAGVSKLAVIASSRNGEAGAVTGTIKLYRNGVQIGSDIGVTLTPEASKAVWQVIEAETDINQINIADTATVSYAVAAGAEGSEIKLELVFMGAV